MKSVSDKIIIKGVRVHNLKNLDIELPKNKLIVFTGLSGSGKSSLAFDTIYAEGQRRYVESLSSYARQFIGIMDKPDVESITGLSPAISIDQKTTSHNPRSTVGTITEIYDYLRLLFARVGHPHCPSCNREISRLSFPQIVERIFTLSQTLITQNSRKNLKVMVLSPVVRDRKGEFSQLFANLRSKGYTRVRIDKQMFSLEEDLVLIKTNKHTIEVCVDRLVIDRQSLKKEINVLRKRLSDAVEQSLKLSDGLVIFSVIGDPSFTYPEKPVKFEDHLFSEKFACPNCNVSLPEIEPRIFSFNSPHGACPTCTGLGILLKIDPAIVINPNLTINEGGILPFAKLILNDTWYGRIVTAAVKEIGFETNRPLKEMTEGQKKAIFYGTGDSIYEVSGKNRHGTIVTIHETFNGIIPELEKRYLETESDYVRKEIQKYLKEEICPACLGKRLKKEALSIILSGLTIVDLTSLSIKSLSNWIKELKPKLSLREKTISELIIREIINRLNFLLSVGLDYLTLDRSAASLAGGEAQRIRLASQIGSGLSGVLYILDEPSIGLHPRDNQRLIETLKNLRDLGNTVIVVEHDKEMMVNADLLVDFGPGAGEHGGKIIAQGTYEEICRNPNSKTGEYLSGKKTIANLQKKITDSTHQLIISGCRENNLKNITAVFPLNNFITVTGVSGSGKSSLVVDSLYPAVSAHFNPYFRQKTGKFTSISGLEYLNRIIIIDQSPIGRTPRSNPATYTGAFSYIRELFAQTLEAKARGYQPGRFSFNVKGGRCEVCEGEGQTRIEMQFLPDVYVTCDVCGGTRFNRETLEVRFKNKNIAEVLQMTVEEALYFFGNIPGLSGKFQTLYDVGLSYIHLGQPAPHLSGGEAQRVKLASELSKKNTKNTLFLLDEPTTGLHFADLEKLLAVLRQLVDMGNTVVVIEHNLDIIKNSDWIIDLGPEGGDNGGEIIATGTPKEIAGSPNSYTGKYLRRILK